MLNIQSQYFWNWYADTIIIQRDELREHFLMMDVSMLCLIDSHIRNNMQLGTD